jgi:hypothetical protein
MGAVRHLVTVCAAIALATAGVACSQPPPRVPDGSICPTSCNTTTRYRLDPAFTDDESNSIREAMRLWYSASGGRACFSEGGSDLILVRVTDRLELRPFADGWHSYAGLYRLGTIWIVVSDLTPRAMVDVAAHEIGHHLGIDHVVDTEETIMHPTKGGRREDATLSERDRTAYCAAHACVCDQTTERQRRGVASRSR